MSGQAGLLIDPDKGFIQGLNKSLEGVVRPYMSTLPKKVNRYEPHRSSKRIIDNVK